MSDNTDFTIIVQNEEFEVHTFVLSASSPVFKKMFASNMEEAAEKKVVINDIKTNIFEKLLIFIYSRKLTVDMDYYANELFLAAEKGCYEIPYEHQTNNLFF